MSVSDLVDICVRLTGRRHTMDKLLGQLENEKSKLVEQQRSLKEQIASREPTGQPSPASSRGRESPKQASHPGAVHVSLKVISAPEELHISQPDGRVRISWFFDELLLEGLADHNHPAKSVSFEVRQQDKGHPSLTSTYVLPCHQTLSAGNEVTEQSFQTSFCEPGKAYLFSVRAKVEVKGEPDPLYSPFSEPVLLPARVKSALNGAVPPAAQVQGTTIGPSAPTPSEEPPVGRRLSVGPASPAASGQGPDAMDKWIKKILTETSQQTALGSQEVQPTTNQPAPEVRQVPAAAPLPREQASPEPAPATVPAEGSAASQQAELRTPASVPRSIPQPSGRQSVAERPQPVQQTPQTQVTEAAQRPPGGGFLQQVVPPPLPLSGSASYSCGAAVAGTFSLGPAQRDGLGPTVTHLPQRSVADARASQAPLSDSTRPAGVASGSSQSAPNNRLVINSSGISNYAGRPLQPYGVSQVSPSGFQAYGSLPSANVHSPHSSRASSTRLSHVEMSPVPIVSSVQVAAGQAGFMSPQQPAFVPQRFGEVSPGFSSSYGSPGLPQKGYQQQVPSDSLQRMARADELQRRLQAGQAAQGVPKPAMSSLRMPSPVSGDLLSWAKEAAHGVPRGKVQAGMETLESLPPPIRNAPAASTLPSSLSSFPRAGGACTLTVLTGESQWEALNFTGADNLEQLAVQFLGRKGLKAAFLSGLVEKMRMMVSTGVAQSSVDIVDLI